jgi:hypothetical protein
MGRDNHTRGPQRESSSSNQGRKKLPTQHQHKLKHTLQALQAHVLLEASQRCAVATSTPRWHESPGKRAGKKALQRAQSRATLHT